MTPARSSWSPLRSGFTLLLLALPLVACQAAPQVRGQIAGLRSLADLAEQSGAKKCAPRELALARAYLEFAELALEEGSVSQARSHLALAELNARAAGVQSPAEHCVPGGSAPQPGDRDGDGYLDPEDQCPEKPETFNGWDDLDGCPDDPDTDGDGLPDSIDACIILPEDADGYLDADGCPEPDDDLDQIPDAQDRCPREAEDPDGYEDDDGCPEPDNDGDGVLDAEDECPNTPGSPHTAPLGCPGNSLVVVTDCEVKITQQIHFATGRDVIQKESYPVLEAVAQVLATNSSIKLEIQGHTDDVGTNKANMNLSDRRAASVRRHLVSRGVELTRLESIGFGEERPLVENNSKENRALNRRVQFMRTEGQKEGCGEAKSSTESASSPGGAGSSD